MNKKTFRLTLIAAVLATACSTTATTPLPVVEPATPSTDQAVLDDVDPVDHGYARLHAEEFCNEIDWNKGARRPGFVDAARGHGRRFDGTRGERGREPQFERSLVPPHPGPHPRFCRDEIGIEHGYLIHVGKPVSQSVQPHDENAKGYQAGHYRSGSHQTPGSLNQTAIDLPPT